MEDIIITNGYSEKYHAALQAKDNTIELDGQYFNKLTQEQQTELNKYNFELNCIIQNIGRTNQELPSAPSFLKKIREHQPEVIIAFLDLLGFKDAIRNDNIESVTEVLNFFDKKLSEPLDFNSHHMVKILKPRISVFSDSIVISYLHPEDNKHQLSQLRLLQYLINNIIMFCLKKGFLVRGGISKGKLHHEGRIIFGEALLEAYELESKLANYPRILFSKSIIEYYKFKNNNALLDDIYSIDFDKMYMLNFFDIMSKTHSAFSQPEELHEYEQQIHVNIERFEKSNLKELSKWNWFLSHWEKAKAIKVSSN